MNTYEQNNDDELMVPEYLCLLAHHLQNAQGQVNAMQVDLAQAFADRYDGAYADLPPALPVHDAPRQSAVVIEAADRFLKRA